MTETAMSARRCDLAMAVFAAADHRGLLHDYLCEPCRRLLVHDP